VRRFGIQSSSNQADRQQLSSHNYECNYQWQQILTRLYNEMYINSVSTMLSLVSRVIDWWRGRCYPYGMYWQPFLATEQTTWSLPYSETSVDRVATRFGCASCVTSGAISCSHSYMRYWLPSKSKIIALCSLPHSENECQWSVNNVQSCIYGNWQVTWPLLSITNILAAFFGRIINDTVTGPFWK